MKAIVLAAGQGTRLRPLTAEVPKCMLPFQGRPVIHRLVSQLRRAGITEVYIVVGYRKESIIEQLREFESACFVENPHFEEDTNILSMRLAVEALLGDGVDHTLVFEADMVFEDALMTYAAGTDFDNRSVWFTTGRFQPWQRGGILRTDGKGNITEIRLVDAYEEMYSEWDKISGIMRITPAELKRFYTLLREYSEQSLAQYYLVPWLENITSLPSVRGDAAYYRFLTFNTLEEFRTIENLRVDPLPEEVAVELMAIDELKPIERYDEARIVGVESAAIKNGAWMQPLCVERNHRLVMDGHHRLALAKRMGLRRIPVVLFDYTEVDVWTLREEIPIDREKVISRVNAGHTYPYKTVKHRFPRFEFKCNTPVELLR